MIAPNLTCRSSSACREICDTSTVMRSQAAASSIHRGSVIRSPVGNSQSTAPARALSRCSTRTSFPEAGCHAYRTFSDSPMRAE